MLCPLERANLSHDLKTERDSFRSLMFSSYLEFRATEKANKPSDPVLHTMVRTLYFQLDPDLFWIYVSGTIYPRLSFRSF
jgi:hypothetical protein